MADSQSKVRVFREGASIRVVGQHQHVTILARPLVDALGVSVVIIPTKGQRGVHMTHDLVPGAYPLDGIAMNQGLLTCFEAAGDWDERLLAFRKGFSLQLEPAIVDAVSRALEQSGKFMTACRKAIESLEGEGDFQAEFEQTSSYFKDAAIEACADVYFDHDEPEAAVGARIRRYTTAGRPDAYQRRFIAVATRIAKYLGKSPQGLHG